LFSNYNDTLIAFEVLEAANYGAEMTTAALINQVSDEQLVTAFKALSNPHRLRIYREILRHQHHDVGPDDASGCLIYDFINKLDIGAPTVSHHVKTLVDANLIRVERNGKYLTCYLNETLKSALSGFLAQNCD